MSYIRLGIGIGVLLALIGAFFYGQSVGENRCEARHLKAAAAVQEKREKQIGQAQTNDAKAAEKDVARETTVREITRETTKVIERPVYRNVCADADGVRLLERSVEAANGGETGGRLAGSAAEVRAAPGTKER